MREEIVLTAVIGGLSFISILLQATVLYGIWQVTVNVDCLFLLTKVIRFIAQGGDKICSGI